MAQPKEHLNPGFKVDTHHNLTKVTEEDICHRGADVIAHADSGIQTTLVANDGKTVRAVIGLNGNRYLPDPTPDPLDEIVNMALDSMKKENR